MYVGCKQIYRCLRGLTAAFKNVADLLVGVHVLLEERLYFLVVPWQCLW